MAQIVPSDISHLALAGATHPELDTLRQLGGALPSAYTGFHRIHWSREYVSAAVFGEADFVIVSSAGRVLVILTMRGVQNSLFSTREQVGNFTLRRFTGEYDLFGNQILTPGQLTFESLRRFKGQQAPAVILVDVEEDSAHPERLQRLLFTGMTRATVRVELVTRMESAGRAAFGGMGEVG